MNPIFIAIDIGASSGRLMKSVKDENDYLSLEEVHRFKNEFRQEDKHDRWQMDYLIKEILTGFEKLKQSGVSHCFAGIDTWAVDYCLLDDQEERLSNPIAYRDHRTNGAVERFSKIYPLKQLYEQTGIQIQPFNTLFQLFTEEKELLARTHKLLLIPDYLGYIFTGKMVTEKTNASTMQLLNIKTKTWEPRLLKAVGISTDSFAPLVEPGTILGVLQKEKFSEYDLPDVTFITVASHDTASAVLGTPGQGKQWGYISSGTWSLLGIETTCANVSRAAFSANYTNEWGAHHTVRFLKNIMGMWLIQEVARSQKYVYSYANLAELAAKEKPLQQVIDVNAPRFLKPSNMIEEIQHYCLETKQPLPTTVGEIARCVYDSLALCYAQELTKVETLTGRKLKKLHIVGGGANNQLLNQLTANYAGVIVEAGPNEATAIGNLIMQMLCMQQFTDIHHARKAIRRSFSCEIFYPNQNKQESLINKAKGVSYEHN
ncbi:rhamnulokinase [Enterococcus ratti]|uniref:Rhamnulokinase n=1 Tax=Enterococcus ratti TaxID=150033 RepID=A0A1L8WKX2_9ENTE|nr:rhamnulokinase [Enterococcus ratti]OJG81676.1 rhamnulokinase [Enterococcus ratti]